MVFVGLVMLASEFTWGVRPMARLRVPLGRWMRWIESRSLAVRCVAGALGVAVLGTVFYVALMTYGAQPEPLRW